MMEYTPVLTAPVIDQMIGEIEQALNQQMRASPLTIRVVFFLPNFYVRLSDGPLTVSRCLSIWESGRVKSEPSFAYEVLYHMVQQYAEARYLMPMGGQVSPGSFG